MTGSFKPAQGDPRNITQYQGAGTLEEAEHELFSVVTEVNIVHLAITLLSVFVTFFGLFSGFVKERLYVGEAIIATAFGIAFSGYGAGVFAPRTWSAGHHFDELTLELTRIIIALSVFAVGVELPKAYVLRHWKSLTMLLGPIMLLGWMVSAALMFAIIPGLEFLPALVVAAGVTPTDPILASSVVGKGKFAQDHVPAHIRHILQAESGCNDGAAFPFLYIALFLLLRGSHTVGQSIGWWIVLVIFYQIVLGIIIGAAVGVAARKLLKFSKRRELIDRESMVAMYVALALLVTGLTTLAGSDDLLAAFACGTAFAWDDWFTESIEESNFSSTIDLLANCAIFIYLGATMPFAAWQDEMLTLTVWRLVLLAAGILAFRRLPAIFALQWWIPDIKTRREAIFAGHFGPMGVGAIFISTLAATKLPTPTVPPETSLDLLALIIEPITYFIVLSSILCHGLTISFFTLGRRVHSRVASFSRTLTSASRDSRGGLNNQFSAAEEPAWMSRVKRAQRGEEIVINRDDDDREPASLAEKGISPTNSMTEGGSSSGKTEVDQEKEAEKKKDGFADQSTLAMFSVPGEGEMTRTGTGAASSGSDTATSDKGKSLEKLDREEVDHAEEEGDEQESGARAARTKAAIERENNEHPSHNILGEYGEDVDDGPADRAAYAKKHPAEFKRLEEEEAREREMAKGETKKEQKSKSVRPPMRHKDSAKEARYCSKNVVQTYQEGRKIIIDRNDGQDVEVIDLDASSEAVDRSRKNDRHEVVTLPAGAVEREKERTPRGDRTPQEHDESAVQRVAHRMMKSGSMLASATAKLKKEDQLSAEEKQRRKQQKMEKDAWCRKEQHYGGENAGPRRRGTREWKEGDQVVTEHTDGSVDVRDLSEEEKKKRVAKHLGALRALGFSGFDGGRGASRSPVPSRVEEDQDESDAERDHSTALDGQALAGPGPRSSARTSSPSPPRSMTPPPTTRPKSTGISLERTDRIEPDSDEEASVEEEISNVKTHSSPKKGGPLKSVKGLFSKGSASSRPKVSAPLQTSSIGRPTAALDTAAAPEIEEPGLAEPSGTQTPVVSAPFASTIRFADVDRPSRDGGATSNPSRVIPSVGSGLNMRRTNTQGSSRSAQ